MCSSPSLLTSSLLSMLPCNVCPYKYPICLLYVCLSICVCVYAYLCICVSVCMYMYVCMCFEKKKKKWKNSSSCTHCYVRSIVFQLLILIVITYFHDFTFLLLFFCFYLTSQILLSSFLFRILTYLWRPYFIVLEYFAKDLTYDKPNKHCRKNGKFLS